MLYHDCSFAQELSPNTVIAIVEGEKITYAQIATNDKAVKLSYRITHGEDPPILDIPILRINKEKKFLIEKIQDILLKKKIEEFGIKVSREEMEEKIKELYKNEDLTEVIRKSNEYWEKLSKALKEAYKYPENEKDIYEVNLTSIMTYIEWTGQRNYFNTLEKISWIEKSLPRTINALYKDEGIKADLLGQKLRDKITENVSVSEKEIKKYYNQKYQDVKEKPKFEAVSNTLERILLKDKKIKVEEEWWVAIYKKADIQIKDDRFSSVNKMIGK